MKPARFAAFAALAFFATLPAAAQDAPRARNVVIFVADGLRYDSVTPDVAPTLWRIRKEGVDFANSHAVYPTLTTVNASAIATGHWPGDTGDYANSLWFGGYRVAAKGGTQVSFFEDDAVLREVKAHFGADYLGQTSLLAAARANGLSTAVIGKIGPAAIQDIAAMDGNGILVDDAANYPVGPDGRPTGFVKIGDELAARIVAAGLPDRAPLPAVPNAVNQAYMTDVATRALLPLLKDRGGNFALLYWCRDPDLTQHMQQDAAGTVVPGINGATGHAGIADADAQLKRLLDALSALGLAQTTDVFVTADHGFSTIAHGLPAAGDGSVPDMLAPGFVAVDVAEWLGQKMWDPDAGNAEVAYMANHGHPSRGSALIGPSPDAPQAVVVANGGSDFIYAPGGADTAKAIYAKLVAAPYVGALFVNDVLLNADPKAFAGALAMSRANLTGASNMPQPAIVVGFRSFLAKGCRLAALLCAAEVADTPLHTGQGMHGSFSRADTRNFMAAIGPDFRKHFVDTAPVSNADVAPTLAHILGITLKGPGSLTGRTASEALAGGKPVKAVKAILRAPPAANGIRTILEYQAVGNVRYFDAAGIPGRTVGLKAK